MELKLLDIFILFLSVWRIASLFSSEEGPFHIFRKIRENAGIKHDENGQPEMWGDKYLANMLSCIWCSSVNIAIIETVFYYFFPEIAIIIFLPFALGALVLLFERLVNG